jgi:hypothetical protein
LVAKRRLYRSFEGRQRSFGLSALGLSFLSYEKTIDEGRVQINGKSLPFRTKFEQAIEMLCQISQRFANTPLLVVTDSWLGNDGLFKPMRKTIGQHTHILSRLRVNAALFEVPKRVKARLGRPKKYGRKLGCATTLAKRSKRYAKSYSVNLPVWQTTRGAGLR